ncbi:sarcosine oxidase subunit gamma [Yoonia sp. 208BN28-4]|uniref:sarcosine oxidase subunit gamma n=1 Tax=Yoonia sp. 208BN28-4 TaxID=3126505 RepID=UPI0030A8915E
MVRLIAKTPCAGLLPVTHGDLRLEEVTYPTITSVAPFKGQATAVSKALKSAVGVSFPKPNRSTSAADTRAIWAGLGVALICGPDAPRLDGAAVTDQSDGWAIVRLSGDSAEDVLARLVPIDLRKQVFPSGQTARTMLAHMSVSVTRIDDSFEVMAMRSMAGTLVHDLETAMRGVAARTT